MNASSQEIVDQITGSLVLPTIGLTLTQEEADAIKEHVRVRLEENVQGAVHSKFVRDVEPPEEIKDLLWDEIPETDEHDDPVSMHNTFVLAGFTRGKEVGSGRRYELQGIGQLINEFARHRPNDAQIGKDFIMEAFTRGFEAQQSDSEEKANKTMTNERLIELALGHEAATTEESVEMATRLLNWHRGPKEEETENDKQDV